MNKQEKLIELAYKKVPYSYMNEYIKYYKMVINHTMLIMY